MDADKMHFMQSWNTFSTEYAKVLWYMALRCDRVQDEYVLKRGFIEWLPESIRHSMRLYCGFKKFTRAIDLRRLTKSLTKLQNDSQNTNTPQHSEKTENQNGNAGCRGFHVNNIESNTSLLLKLARKNPPSLRSPPTAMHIWHQHDPSP